MNFGLDVPIPALSTGEHMKGLRTFARHMTIVWQSWTRCICCSCNSEGINPVWHKSSTVYCDTQVSKREDKTCKKNKTEQATKTIIERIPANGSIIAKE